MLCLDDSPIQGGKCRLTTLNIFWYWYLVMALTEFENKIETEAITRNHSQNILIRFFPIKQGDLEKITMSYKVCRSGGIRIYRSFLKILGFQTLRRKTFLSTIFNSTNFEKPPIDPENLRSNFIRNRYFLEIASFYWIKSNHNILTIIPVSILSSKLYGHPDTCST
jgi:hypothetical protein